MNDPLVALLKLAFLAVLYLFLVWVVRSARRQLDVAGPAPPEPVMATVGENARAVALDLHSGLRPRLEVVAALGHQPGEELAIDGGATLGRAASADVVVQDPFASAAHARIFAHGGFMWIEDLGSTNGTYVNCRRVTSPQRLRPSDVIRIGDSEYRYWE
ncbi:FHA domain-containing protein FhaB [bacterium HR41]|nr:FHA domain-containing protein FhaB [bacterium HR41]